MARWEPDGRRRLQEAALELFDEHGFEATTAAQIAERAGLTERTFFRHFGDKREALFGNEQVVTEALVDAVGAAPENATPRELVAAGLAAAADHMQPRRAALRRQLALIQAYPELLERDLRKQASMGEALAGALAARGVAGPSARLFAGVGIAALRSAYEQWMATARAKQDLATLTRAALDEVARF